MVAVALTLCIHGYGPSIAYASDPPEIVKSVCSTCHGIDGNSADPAYPKIAGMHEEYLTRQLSIFSLGERQNDQMTEIVAKLSPKDFAGLASYFSRQRSSPGKVGAAELAEKGRKIFEDGNVETGIPACAGCHQLDGKGNGRFPRLAGQHQTYVVKQLNEYRSGRRNTDPLMSTVGQRLTPEEIRAVAEFVAGL